MTRDQAWSIVCEFVQSDSLRRHMLAVEACVTAYAGKFGNGIGRVQIHRIRFDVVVVVVKNQAHSRVNQRCTGVIRMDDGALSGLAGNGKEHCRAGGDDQKT